MEGGGKRALITGITGQIGSYTAEHLLGHGYEVHGLVRRDSSASLARIDGFKGLLKLHAGDLTDSASLRRVLSETLPDEVYHFAGHGLALSSLYQSESIADTVGTGALRLLEAVREAQNAKGRLIKVAMAGSSEMFGSAAGPLNEASPLRPQSPFAVAKAAAHWHGVNFRESQGMHICNAILFGQESPRRGAEFVSRRITLGLTRIRLGLQDRLTLESLDTQADWGFAGDSVRAMRLMLQQPEPGDYVIAAEEVRCVGDFLEEAAARLKIDWRRVVDLAPSGLRPSVAGCSLGDAAKAREVLGWKPEVSFRKLAALMVDADFARAQQELLLRSGGERLILAAA